MTATIDTPTRAIRVRLQHDIMTNTVTVTMTRPGGTFGVDELALLANLWLLASGRELHRLWRCDRAQLEAVRQLDRAVEEVVIVLTRRTEGLTGDPADLLACFWKHSRSDGYVEAASAA